MTHRPFRNLDMTTMYKKASQKARRVRNTQAKKAAPGAPRVAIARNVLAWQEKNSKRMAVQL